jgi:hypothetical protein
MGYKWIDHFSVAVKTREEGVATYRDKLGLKNLAPLRESGQGSYVGCLCLDDDDRFLEVLRTDAAGRTRRADYCDPRRGLPHDRHRGGQPPGNA